MLKNQKVLVTGATGFTGNLLTQKLCALGAEVHAIRRKKTIPEALTDLPITWHVGDVFDPAVIENAMQGIHYVFHVAAAYREAKISDETYWNVHLKSTQLLAEAATRQEGFRRFLHVSTVGVLGHIASGRADENSPYNPGDVYQESKAEAEKWLLGFADKNSLPFTVIRPAAIYGPGDRRLLKLFKMAKLPVVPILGFGGGFYHLVHVEDLTDFMLEASVQETAAGEIIICGAKESTPIKEIIRMVADQLSKKTLFLHLPAWPFFAIAYLCEGLCKPLNLEPFIYPRRVAFFTKDRKFNTEKMRSLFNYQDRYSVHKGIEQTLKWYQEKKWL